jgi:16S rRNA (guanine966-N2)-methyltransferase
MPAPGGRWRFEGLWSMARGKRRVRMIGGELKGRLLDYPEQGRFRPTMQRTRSSVFESLGHSIRGAVFVDLYAAAGGIGIEALSRGARFCCFVESDREAVAHLHRNLESCRVAAERYSVHAGDVAAFLEGSLGQLAPDIVYADPPYGDTDFGVLLELLGAIVYPQPAVIVGEHPTSLAMAGAPGLTRSRVKSFGQTSVSFFVSDK